MPLTLIDRIFMSLRKAPIKLIADALQIAESEGFDVSAQDLELHSLAGGNPLKVVEALVEAKRQNINTTFNELAAFNLGVEKDLIKIIQECVKKKEFTFDTYSPDFPVDKIIGFCKDGSEVHASCTLTYQLPIQHIFGKNPEKLQEFLSAKLAVFINTSDSYKDLRLNKDEHEANLLRRSKESYETVKSLKIDYRHK